MLRARWAASHNMNLRSANNQSPSSGCRVHVSLAAVSSLLAQSPDMSSTLEHMRGRTPPSNGGFNWAPARGNNPWCRNRRTCAGGLAARGPWNQARSQQTVQAYPQANSKVTTYAPETAAQAPVSFIPRHVHAHGSLHLFSLGLQNNLRQEP